MDLYVFKTVVGAKNNIIISQKNATPGKVFKVYRGVRDPADLGRIVEFDGKPEMEVWPTDECNQISGTDGTIFPTYLTEEQGLDSFSPDLCRCQLPMVKNTIYLFKKILNIFRSLKAIFEKKDKYDDIPVNSYYAILGDMSKNENEKCYCYTPDTCLKKGVIDLYKCSGVPIYASLPHFYDSDESYLKGVKGLHPNETEHRIKILFEPVSIFLQNCKQLNMSNFRQQEVQFMPKNVSCSVCL